MGASRARSVVAWSLVALCALSALLSVFPPFTSQQVRLAVLTQEESPLFLLLTIAVAPIAGFLARGRSRTAMGGALLVTALIQYRPLAGANRFDGFSFSLRQALFGDTSRVPITERSVDYAAADDSKLSMLLFRRREPGGQSPEPLATIVTIYGGAWSFGSADQAIDVSRHFARRGYMVIAIDYRHAPVHHYPAAIDDVRRSLALIRDSAAAWGVDMARVALIGRSAGGHLALLAAYAPPPDSVNTLPIRAVAALYAPYDLPVGYDDRPIPDPADVRAVLRDFIGGPPSEFPKAYHDASPSSYIRRGLPQTLLVYAAHDHLVQAKFGQRAASDLFAAAVPVRYVELPWAEHGFDRLPGGLGSQLVLMVLDKFFKETL